MRCSRPLERIQNRTHRRIIDGLHREVKLGIGRQAHVVCNLVRLQCRHAVIPVRAPLVRLEHVRRARSQRTIGK